MMKKSLLIAASVLFVAVSFILSSLPGKTTSKVVYSHLWLLNSFRHWIPDNLELNYQGSLIKNREAITYDPYFSQGSISHTSSPNAVVELEFHGDKVSWNGYASPNGGIVSVALDGKEIRQVDQYADRSIKQTMFESPILQLKNHTLTLTATGRHHASSDGYAILVDGFSVWKAGQIRNVDNTDSAIRYLHANEFEYYQFIVRKIVHFVFFAGSIFLLALLMRWAGYRRKAWMVPAIAGVWAAADEIHQSFVPGRHPMMLDVIVDLLGVATGYGLYILVSSIGRIRQRRTSR